MCTRRLNNWVNMRSKRSTLFHNNHAGIKIFTKKEPKSINRRLSRQNISRYSILSIIRLRIFMIDQFFLNYCNFERKHIADATWNDDVIIRLNIYNPKMSDFWETDRHMRYEPILMSLYDFVENLIFLYVFKCIRYIDIWVMFLKVM